MQAVSEQDVAEFFSYQPLDLKKAAIRLVRLLPDLSRSGLVQCTISHNTIEASYTCLSYRWGVPEPNGLIIINDKLFRVRQNLLDFLDMARQSAEATEVFWIDAICIDQSQVLERNHQVAQMGEIYSHAMCVYVWLGANRDLQPTLQILKDPGSATPEDWDIVFANRRRLKDYVCRNQYWERAWIVQEIFLARAALIWLDTQCVSFEYLHWSIDYFYLSWESSPIARFKLPALGIPDPRKAILKFRERQIFGHRGSLLTLLANFREMKCEIPRDRVFSLLSMATDARRYSVNYNSTDVDACFAVLKQCGRLKCLCVPGLFAESMGSTKGLLKQFEHQCCVIEVEPAAKHFVISMDDHRGPAFGTAFFGDPDWRLFYNRNPCQSLKNIMRYIGRPMEYDEKEGRCYADDFNIRMPVFGEDALVVEIALSSLHKLTQASPADCTTLQLGASRLFNINIYVKHSMWKTTNSVSEETTRPAFLTLRKESIDLKSVVGAKRRHEMASAYSCCTLATPSILQQPARVCPPSRKCRKLGHTM